MQDYHTAGPGGGPPAGFATRTPQATEAEKGLAAVSYILTWLTGLIIFLVAKKEQKYARWNAIQAIGLGVALVVIGIVLGILDTILLLGAGIVGFGLFTGLFWLLAIILIILTAVKAYQGTPIRLPVIADIADRNA